MGIFSGVTSAGINISSARAGGNSGNSSDIKLKINDVLPTPSKKGTRKFQEFTKIFRLALPSPTKRIRTSFLSTMT